MATGTPAETVHAGWGREQRRFFVDNLITSVKLADISTRCSSHPHSKSEVRCEFDGGFYRHGSYACMSVQLGAELEAPMQLALVQPAPLQLFHVHDPAAW